MFNKLRGIVTPFTSNRLGYIGSALCIGVTLSEYFHRRHVNKMFKDNDLCKNYMNITEIDNTEFEKKINWINSTITKHLGKNKTHIILTHNNLPSVYMHPIASQNFVRIPLVSLLTDGNYDKYYSWNNF